MRAATPPVAPAPITNITIVHAKKKPDESSIILALLSKILLKERVWERTAETQTIKLRYWSFLALRLDCSL